MHQPLIGLINDDPAIIEMLESLLEYEGYRTISSNSGQAGFKMIQHCPPVLVILDMQMEHKDAGLRVLELMRLDPRTENIPVILCSADGAFLRAKATQLENYRCVTLEKPYKIDELLDIIEQHVGDKHV